MSTATSPRTMPAPVRQSLTIDERNKDTDTDDDQEDDLYGDLESNIFDRVSQQNNTQQVPTANSIELETLLASAYEENHRLKLKLKELSKTHAIVLKNASSLHETAKLQLSQKNQVVKSLQKKLLELRTKDVAVERQEWKEIDELIMACLSSIPTYSFQQLCQQAMNGIQHGHGERETRTNNWTKKFNYENVSYYFYSHHQKAVHTEPIMDIQYVDPVPLVGEAKQTGLHRTEQSTKKSCVDPLPTLTGTPTSTNASNSSIPTLDSTELTKVKQNGQALDPVERKQIEETRSDKTSWKIKENSSSGELTPSPEPPANNLEDLNNTKEKEDRSITGKPIRRRRSVDRDRDRDGPGRRLSRDMRPKDQEWLSPADSSRSRSGRSSEGYDYDDPERDRDSRKLSASGRSKKPYSLEIRRERGRSDRKSDRDHKNDKVWDRVRNSKVNGDARHRSRDRDRR